MHFEQPETPVYRRCLMNGVPRQWKSFGVWTFDQTTVLRADWLKGRGAHQWLTVPFLQDPFIHAFRLPFTYFKVESVLGVCLFVCFLI